MMNKLRTLLTGRPPCKAKRCNLEQTTPTQQQQQQQQQYAVK